MAAAADLSTGVPQPAFATSIASSQAILEPGTPVFIVGAYDFDAPPAWRSTEWLVQQVELPPLPLGRRGT